MSSKHRDEDLNPNKKNAPLFSFTAHPPSKGPPITSIFTFFQHYYLAYHFYLVQLMSVDLPPGKHIIPQRYAINLQKGLIGIYIVFLMWYYKSYNPTSYTYLVLHGSYGIAWLIKDYVFGDIGWTKKVTILAFLSNLLFVLGPYSLFPIFLMSNKVHHSLLKLAIVSIIHTTALVVVICADCQKYYSLKYNGGKLITEGFFKYSRNTNFLAEIIIYGCYAYLSSSVYSYFILLWSWWAALFNNMFLKEAFLEKLDGYKEYCKQSGFLFPKIF